MKRTQIPLYSDTLFAFIVGFLLSLIIIRYYAFPLWACLTVSTVCALAFAFIVFLALKARLEDKYLLAKDEELKNKLLLHLALDQAENNRRLFAKLLKAENFAVQRKDGTLIVDDECIFLEFTMEPLSADEIARIIKRPWIGNKTIYCNDLSSDARKLCNDFRIKVIPARELFLRLKEQELLPKTFLCPTLPKRTLKEKCYSFFRKSLARPYFLSGIGILALSFFTPYRTYYLISGCFLLVLSLTLRLFGITAKE